MEEKSFNTNWIKLMEFLLLFIIWFQGYIQILNFYKLKEL